MQLAYFPNSRTGQWRYCVVNCRPRGRCKCLATTTAVMALLGAAHSNYWTVARPPPLPHCRPAPVSGVAIAWPAPALQPNICPLGQAEVAGAGAGEGAIYFQWDRWEDAGAVHSASCNSPLSTASLHSLLLPGQPGPLRGGGESHSSMCCLSKQQKC